ncbi:URC4/urg3 family protein [Oscillatoria sp. FACHB-1407]|uniref:URC4/urg3 family protein n=1 Tax=Oscillatoria sp. FACHB-1407 TaxID=2692847 RepID=UPI0016857B1A|nr:URC4/urg3 family protein [Oscillatoria sp. FACHB-1407]MBD2463992.1 URC4/urg3 family protein [Oscillatoria sp. FACHB-1407]
MVANFEGVSQAEQEAIAYLRSPQAIRDRCDQLFELACQDQLQHFRCDLSQLEPTAAFVLQVMQANYPDLQVPFHSRWRHFDVGGVARVVQLQQQLASLSPLEQARAKFDLAIVSVLLDAGAGAVWQYVEADSGQVFRRSEGLAVASFQMFCQGLFSSHPDHPLQVDATGLQQLTETTLAQGFQVTDENPLVGLEGRLALLQQLGQALHSHPQLFGETNPRPGYLVDYLAQRTEQHKLAASEVFAAVLQGLSEIWAGRVAIAGVNLGDVWAHSALPQAALGSNLVPFHKLSQWLTYSLLEPLQELGIEITGLDQLTGLAEYRNGGLCFDMGLIQAKHPNVTTQPHLPSSEVIVEWRALTVVLLDAIANTIRQTLNLTPQELPLVKVLEGGTWAAGRAIAAEKRSGGTPPIQIQSDGTVF